MKFINTIGNDAEATITTTSKPTFTPDNDRKFVIKLLFNFNFLAKAVTLFFMSVFIDDKQSRFKIKQDC